VKTVKSYDRYIINVNFVLLFEMIKILITNTMHSMLSKAHTPNNSY